MPICFAQGIANSETVCAIFTEQKPNDWEAQSKLFATGAMSNRLCVCDLFAENKYRGQCGQTIAVRIYYVLEHAKKRGILCTKIDSSQYTAAQKLTVHLCSSLYSSSS